MWGKYDFSSGFLLLTLLCTTSTITWHWWLLYLQFVSHFCFTWPVSDHKSCSLPSQIRCCGFVVLHLVIFVPFVWKRKWRVSSIPCFLCSQNCNHLFSPILKSEEFQDRVRAIQFLCTLAWPCPFDSHIVHTWYICILPFSPLFFFQMCSSNSFHHYFHPLIVCSSFCDKYLQR